MNEIIMWIMACGAIIGGIDRILGNRFGLGDRFEEGFRLLGATALSMAGIICVTPLISKGIQFLFVPMFQAMNLDPAIMAGLIAIDMGGYPLAVELTDSVEMIRYAGLVVSATLGCTIVFTIPVGMGMIKEEDQPFFAKGIMIGICTLPIGLFLGGILSGLSVITWFLQSIPIFLVSILLIIGIWKFQKQTVKGFTIFAGGIRILTTIGLMAGAFTYMTGVELIPGLTPIEEAMKVVSSIGVILLGSLPIVELLQRTLRKPFHMIGKKIGINSESVSGLIVTIVSPVPVLAIMHKMDEKGKVMNAAYMVFAVSTLAAHMGYTYGVDANFVMAIVSVKIIGGLIACITTLKIK